MKTTVAVILFALASACSAVEVQATATGKTFDEAVSVAKSNALAQVTGEFVVSTTTSTNSKYNEDITQYSGGVIRSHKVTSTFNDGQYITVNIVADIDPSKDNNMIVDSGTDVPQSAKQSLIEHMQRSDNINRMSDRLDDPNVAFTIIPGQIKYVPQGKTTNIQMTVGVKLSPKWIDDVKVFSREAGKKIDTDTPMSDVLWGVGTVLAPASMVGSSIIRSAAHLSEKKQEIDAESNCFSVDNQHDVDECYAVGRMFSNVVRTDRYQIIAHLWSGDKVVAQLPIVVINNNQLFVLYDIGTNLYFKNVAKERRFASRGVLWFHNGIAASTITHTVNTNVLSTVDRIEYVMR